MATKRCAVWNGSGGADRRTETVKAKTELLKAEKKKRKQYEFER